MFLAVLGLSGVALAADRMFFASAEVAAASPAIDEFAIAPDPSTPGDSSAVDIAALVARRKLQSVGDRLLTYAQTQAVAGAGTPDPFLPDWVRPVAHPTTGSTSASIVPEVIDPAKFAHDYRLTAVMGAGPGQYAVMNGRVLRVGDRIEQFELDEVSERSARFRSPEGKVVVFTLEGTLP